MEADDNSDVACSPCKKEKCESGHSLLNIFVNYVAAQQSTFYSEEEICKCVQTLQQKTSTTTTEFQSVVREKLNCLLPTLLDCNDDVNFLNENGQTILHIFVVHYTDKTSRREADWSKDREIVETLLEKGASVDIVDLDQSTPVHYAASNRRNDLVQLMLGSFTNLNAANICGYTVMHVLVYNYSDHPNDFDIENARTLVSKGANFNGPRDHNKSSPMTVAIAHGLIKLLEVFKSDQDDPEKLLFQICESATDWSNHPGELQHLDRLVGLGKHVHSRSGIYRLTPLHYVSKFGQKAAVELFLNAGADIDVESIDGVTPLHLAVMNGHLEVVKFLIDTRANCNRRDSVCDFGLMHMAAFKGNTGIFNLLLEQGLSLQDTTRDGFTPLHLAAMDGNDLTIDYLITHGVDVHCRTFTSRLTPLHLAAMKTFIYIDEYRRATSIVYPIFASLNQHKLRLVDSIIALLRAGASVNARDWQQKTPLHHAVARLEYTTHRTSISSLLEHGAYVDVKDTNGMTPMRVAAKDMAITGGVFTNTYRTLLRYGAEIDNLNISEGDITLSTFKKNFDLYELVKHVTFVHKLDLPINDNHAEAIDQSLLYKRYFIPRLLDRELTALDHEIDKMKAHRLTPGGSSMYEFLRMTSSDRCYFARSILSSDLTDEYPLCCVVIESRCRQALRRKLLVNLASPQLNRLIEYNFPETCTDIMFRFLTLTEITFFIHGMENFQL